MKIQELEYYKTVTQTQNDPEILKGELKDLINEIERYFKKQEENACKGCTYYGGLTPKCLAPALMSCP